METLIQKQDVWLAARLSKIKAEAERVIEKVDAANNPYDLELVASKRIAAVKRATLDFNEEAVKLRKGWYHYVTSV